MVGHAPVINKPRHKNRGRAHRVSKAAAKKQTVRVGGVVVPGRRAKKVHQVEKRLRHQLADEKQRLAVAGLLDAVVAEMDIDDGVPAASASSAAAFVTPGGASAAAALLSKKKRKGRRSAVAAIVGSAAAVAALTATSSSKGAAGGGVASSSAPAAEAAGRRQ
jgi:hypothetical protein